MKNNFVHYFLIKNNIRINFISQNFVYPKYRYARNRLIFRSVQNGSTTSIFLVNNTTKGAFIAFFVSRILEQNIYNEHERTINYIKDNIVTTKKKMKQS